VAILAAESGILPDSFRKVVRKMRNSHSLSVRTVFSVAPIPVFRLNTRSCKDRSPRQVKVVKGVRPSQNYELAVRPGLNEILPMATPNVVLVSLLRETADRIDTGASYQWSHFGKCNCGHLAQSITRLSAEEIHKRTFQKLEEWSEIPEEYCGITGFHLDYVVDALFEVGLTREDIRHLEDLSDPKVLRHLPDGRRYLQRNQRADAVLYFRTWANQLTKALAETLPGEFHLADESFVEANRDEQNVALAY